ncbi:unnamed protein product, partial [Sphacelaria rigidula]
MASRVTGRVIAAAGSGFAVGAAGMFAFDRQQQSTESPEMATSSEEATASTSRALPALSVKSSSPVASDFLAPFVEHYGLPDLDQVILPSQEYTSCWDSRTRNVRWVVERINKATLTGCGDRSRASFKADSRLQPLFRTELSDYRGSGLDRGHLAPAGDHKTTEEYLKETFLLTNMAPQDPSFNRGYWADFEEFVRLLVVPKESSSGGSSAASGTSSVGPPFKDVYVITGPLFLPSLESKHAGGGDSEG